MILHRQYLQIDNADFIKGFKKNLETLSQIFTKQNNFDEFIEEVERDIAELYQLPAIHPLKVCLLWWMWIL